MDYADKRIHDALKMAKGNKPKARKLIAAWAYQEPELLKALTRNHLSGIVAYHLERVMAGKTVGPAKEQKKAKTVKLRTDDKVSRDLLQAMNNAEAAVFGFEGTTRSPGKGQASQRHINAIQLIAARSRKKSV